MTYEDALDIVQRHEHVPLEEAEPWLEAARAQVLKHQVDELGARLAELGAEIESLRKEEEARAAARELVAAEHAARLRRNSATAVRRARRGRYSVPVAAKLLLQPVAGDTGRAELVQYETGAFCVRVPAALLAAGLSVCAQCSVIALLPGPCEHCGDEGRETVLK